jgi:hypothetical protein
MGTQREMGSPCRGSRFCPEWSRPGSWEQCYPGEEAVRGRPLWCCICELDATASGGVSRGKCRASTESPTTQSFLHFVRMCLEDGYKGTGVVKRAADKDQENDRRFSPFVSSPNQELHDWLQLACDCAILTCWPPRYFLPSHLHGRGQSCALRAGRYRSANGRPS